MSCEKRILVKENTHREKNKSKNKKTIVDLLIF